MTCIVGLEHDNGMVSIGGDSAGTTGWLQRRIRTDEKVFINGQMIFGFTGSFRMGQLLRYSLSVPEQLPSQTDDFRFMCTAFIDAVRQCLKGGGYAKAKDGEESGGTFLVGYRGRLYRVEDDFQVGRSTLTFEACGCGVDFSMGAMWAGDKEQKPDERIREALACAANFSAGVAPPFFILRSDGVSGTYQA
jgi:ATP-dependent protease HslVU (ClpYQ) peptidase subunit